MRRTSRTRAAAVVVGAAVLTVQPASAATSHKAEFLCPVSAGKVKLTLTYHVSPGHVLYGDGAEFRSAAPGFAINQVALGYRRKLPDKEPTWESLGEQGSSVTANTVHDGDVFPAPAGGTALFNLQTDGVGDATWGNMIAGFQDGTGPTYYCEVVVRVQA